MVQICTLQISPKNHDGGGGGGVGGGGGGGGGGGERALVTLNSRRPV